MVDGGVSLKSAIAEIRADFGGCAWASWGTYDRKKLARQTEVKSSGGLPFGDSHYNVRNLAALATGSLIEPKPPETAAALGLEWQGHYHRGIDDARMIARIFATYMKRIHGVPVLTQASAPTWVKTGEI